MANAEKSSDTNGEKMAEGSGKAQAQGDAIAMLKADHRAVEKLFADHKSASTRARKGKIFEQIAMALKVHAMLEETIFYPAVREQADSDDKLDEAQVEHDTLKILIQDLESSSDNAFRDAKVKVLCEYVQHHVREEEGSGGILEQARKAGLDLAQLGTQMAQRKQELEADPSAINSAPVSIEVGASGGRKSTRTPAAPRSERSGEGESRQRRTRSPDSGDEGNYRETRARRSEQDRYEDEGRGRDMRERSARYEDDRGRRGYSSAGREDMMRRRGGDERSYGGREAGRRGYDERDERQMRREPPRQEGRSDPRDRERERERRGDWYGNSQGNSQSSRRGWDGGR